MWESLSPPKNPRKFAFKGRHRSRVINLTATEGESLRVSPASNCIKWLHKSDRLQLITLSVTTPTSFLLLWAFKNPNEQIWNRFKWKIGLSLLIKSTSLWFMDLCYHADLSGGSAHTIPTRRCNSLYSHIIQLPLSEGASLGCICLATKTTVTLTSWHLGPWCADLAGSRLLMHQGKKVCSKKNKNGASGHAERNLFLIISLL